MAKENFLSDYKQLPISVERIDLSFFLDLKDGPDGVEYTRVSSAIKLALKEDSWKIQTLGDLFLNGRSDIKLESLSVNKTLFPANTSSWRQTVDGIYLNMDVLFPFLSEGNLRASEALLEIVVRIKPQENTLLEGLYKSGGMFSTQCEAEGFRGITYFFDRPDILTIYRVRIEADKNLYPILLSNGNRVDVGEVEGDSSKHYAEWMDPFPKPCYLFALVAGSLTSKNDTFVTCSGKQVRLSIWVPQRDIDKVDHAMTSLKLAMKWDEVTFGLEYDLDLFNIVAVPDFNMGAMENKSLNIFNSRAVLSSPASATDMEMDRVQGIIAHEYFHNWTGNRVTCRDWFQLTLKEGLTVYRDQEFTSDHNSRPVKRLQDVLTVRNMQFSEDAGPMAHPIRPKSYIKMDNFYTSTVYRKGAEVIRMYEALLGKQGFRKGMDLYFLRHDGQAVTCDDFLRAMQDANGVDLSGLAVWYSRAGTPQLTASVLFDPLGANGTGSLTLTLTQAIPPIPGKEPDNDATPLLIPVRIAILGPDAKPLNLYLRGESADLGAETVLKFNQQQQVFEFEKVGSQRPVVSLLRNFSAPVRLTFQGQLDSDLTFLLRHDFDPFNRFEAGQVLAKKLLFHLYTKRLCAAEGSSLQFPDADTDTDTLEKELIEGFRCILQDSSLDGQFKALTISLPSQSELLGSGFIPLCDPVMLHEEIVALCSRIAQALRPELTAIIEQTQTACEGEFVFNSEHVARRALVNKAYSYLIRLNDSAIERALLQRMLRATNMTDEYSALLQLNGLPLSDDLVREEALAAFQAKWKGDQLVMLKWITAQALSERPGNCANLLRVAEADCFSLTNPNSVQSLYWTFAHTAVNFHAKDGSGYENDFASCLIHQSIIVVTASYLCRYSFLADAILLLDGVNHQVAARLVKCFTGWRGLDLGRQALIQAQLRRILSKENLSGNVFEIASKSVASA